MFVAILVTGRTSLSYVGCFADKSDDRDLPVSTAALEGGDRQGSLIDCAGQCAGYEYMGLQFTSECFCGNSYGSQGTAECPDDCGLPTSGAGCENRNAVYRLPDYGKVFVFPSFLPSFLLSRREKPLDPAPSFQRKPYQRRH